MARIEGSIVLKAFCALGHEITVNTWTEDHEQIVQVDYHEPGVPVVQHLTMTTSLEVFLAHRAPEDLIAEAVGEAIDRLVDPRVRSDVGRVVVAMERGPLACELIGGPRDGEVLHLPPTEPGGLPLVRFYVPLASPPDWSVGYDVTVPSELLRVAAYDREYVNPATLHWRYLAVKA